MELIEKILNLYLSFADTVNIHFYKFTIAFVFISIFWISFIGIVTPVLLISALAFGYFGIIISLFSLVLGSLISFFIAIKTKGIIKKLQQKKPIVSKDPFILYIIFRLIPGVPFLIKNLSVIFFKLNLKSFFLAVIISDTPQIVIFTFFFKKLIDSSNEFLINRDFNRIFEQMYLPLLVIILFMFFIFFLKRKKSIVYEK